MGILPEFQSDKWIYRCFYAAQKSPPQSRCSLALRLTGAPANIHSNQHLAFIHIEITQKSPNEGDIFDQSKKKEIKKEDLS